MISYEQALILCRSYPESAARLICDLSARVDMQQRQIELLQKKVADLERIVAQLSKNSSNSSKPPSSDITRPKPKRLPKGKRKIGAQPRHPRDERPLFSETDITEFYDYRLTACPECNNPDVIFLDRPPRIIQQIELETFVVTKEEHRSYPVWCERCGKIHYHPFPEHVVKEGLLKERLTALVAYMKDFDVTLQFCIAHLIRDVKFLTGLPDDQTKAYGKKLLAAIKNMFKIIHLITYRGLQIIRSSIRYPIYVNQNERVDYELDQTRSIRWSRFTFK